jgi:uncharacterized protein YacL
MPRRLVKGNVSFFCYGFLSFLMGILLPSSLLINAQVAPPFWHWFIAVIAGLFFIYVGLALLFQAGLGSFWNEIVRQIDKIENDSAPKPIPWSIGPDGK